MSAPISIGSRVAYRVPFRVERSQAPRYRLINTSAEPLIGVSVTLVGSGVLPATPPVRIPPGGNIVLHVLAREPEVRTIAVIRWFRPDGTEYLWRFSF